MEDQVYHKNKICLELLQQIREQEVETEVLKAYCVDLKAKVAVYIPIKGDDVDERLAEYVNNYPDRTRLKVMFLREKTGVYQFGSRRVNVRIEKNKILIRVGGGFLGIDEFLDQYTPDELAKIQQRDPLKRFSEKVALAKAVQGRDVSPLVKNQ